MGSWSDRCPLDGPVSWEETRHIFCFQTNQNQGVSDPTSLRFCWWRHWAAASVQWAWCRHSAGELVGAAFFLQGSIKRGIITLMDLHVYLSHISLLLRSALLWLRVIKLRSELWKYWIYSGAAALRSTAPRGDILYVVFSAFILQQRPNFTERPVWSTDSGSGVAVVQFGPVYLEMAAYTTSHSLHSPLLYVWIFMHVAVTQTSCSFFVLARFLTDPHGDPVLLWTSVLDLVVRGCNDAAGIN